MDKVVEEWLDLMLEDESFEDVLERFNITPHEAFEILIREGLIDEQEIYL
jgi:hypothetical protein